MPCRQGWGSPKYPKTSPQHYASAATGSPQLTLAGLTLDLSGGRLGCTGMHKNCGSGAREHLEVVRLGLQETVGFIYTVNLTGNHLRHLWPCLGGLFQRD